MSISLFFLQQNRLQRQPAKSAIEATVNTAATEEATTIIIPSPVKIIVQNFNMNKSPSITTCMTHNLK